MMATAAEADRALAEKALAAPEPGLEMVRRMFGFVVWGIYRLPDDDPMREPLAQVGEILTNALAATVE